MKLKTVFGLMYHSARQTARDDGIEHAGYLSFLALLSIFPALIFMFTIGGALGRKDFAANLITELTKVMPADVLKALNPVIHDIVSGPPHGILTIAIIGAIWTASGTVEAIRTILNRVYRVSNPPHFIWRRLVSMMQFVILSFLVIVALFLLTIVPGMIKFLHLESYIGSFLTVVRYCGSGLMMFIGICITYWVLPNIKQRVWNIVPGAALCLFFWLIIINLFTVFVSYYPRVNTVYGSLAGVILTLLFFYVMNIVYVFGAEFNYALEKYLGHMIEEKEKK